MNKMIAVVGMLAVSMSVGACGARGYYEPKTVPAAVDVTTATTGPRVYLSEGKCLVRVVLRDGRETRPEVDMQICRDAQAIIAADAKTAAAVKAAADAAAKAKAAPATEGSK